MDKKRISFVPVSGQNTSANAQRVRFSLRNLFLAMTLIATVIGAAANYPIVLFASLCLLSPFLFTAAMVYFENHAPIVVRLVQLAICLAVLLLATFAFIFAIAPRG
jgi:hypothetical protein